MRSLTSLVSMPVGWLNSPEGADWFRRRATAFELMQVRLHELQAENQK
jgi:hypothetical protein